MEERNGKQAAKGKGVPISPRSREPLFVSRLAFRYPMWSAEFTEQLKITTNQVLFQQIYRVKADST